jgi:hypothetical protein
VNRELAEKVADAVLYEGYMLYPYRPSAIKNRQRWTFGILYPPGYHEVRAGTERAGMHSECVLVTGGNAILQVQLRFLHLLARRVMSANEKGAEPVPALTVNGQLIESWDEGKMRTVELETPVAGHGPAQASFNFAATRESEPLRDARGRVLGSVEHIQHEVTGRVTVSWQEIGRDTFKVAIDIANESMLTASVLSRNDALLRSMLSAHTIVTAQCGEFVSLLDPPPELRAAVHSCRNVGNFPVLVGEQGARDMLLCSPIVLYDYPRIAPESAGDFYDATEMDEMLTLHVMTLTEEEKNEMRLAGEHADNLLQRTEETAREQLQRTHGVIRSLRPVRENHD